MSGDRISRQTWWQLVFFGSVLILILFFYANAKIGFLKTNPWLLMDLFIPLMCAGISYVTLKRFHDRNKSGLWSLLFIIPAMLYLAFMSVGMIAPHYSSISNDLYSILKIPMNIAFLWWLIECGFLKGTNGSNTYGPNPLESVK